MRVATIGFFDGVHRGHQFLIRQVIEEADRRGGIPTCITFSNHPRMVVGNGVAVRFLTTPKEKEELLLHFGIKEVRMLEFTKELAGLSAYEFMKSLREKIDVEVLVIGYDHRFGHNRIEDFNDYVRYGKELGIEVVKARVFKEEGITVSSSLIRDELLQGRVADVPALLGYEYFVEGTVVGGFQIGRKIGYPTANIKTDGNKLIPCDGVYAVRVVVDEREYGGMLNIGCRPTFGGGKRSIEVNLFDFDLNIYSETVRVYFVGFLRHEKKFESLDEFINQLSHDEENARAQLYNGDITQH